MARGEQIIVVVLAHRRRGICHFYAAGFQVRRQTVREIPSRLVVIKAKRHGFDRVMGKIMVQRRVGQPAQSKIIHAAPGRIVLVLPERRTGQSIYGGLIHFHRIAGRDIGANQKSILLLATRHIAAKGSATAPEESRPGLPGIVFASKHAVAVFSPRGLIQQTILDAVPDNLWTDATVLKISRRSFDIAVRRGQLEKPGFLLFLRNPGGLLSWLKRGCGGKPSEREPLPENGYTFPLGY